MLETLTSPPVPLGRRKSLSHLVYTEMVDRIFNGAYRVGDRLPTEEELARGFAVSRVTVRQALLRLRECRLVVSLQGSGNYVGGMPLGDSGSAGKVMDKASYGEMFDFLVGLETQTAALAAQNRTDSNIDRMKEALEAHELRGEPSLDWLIRYRKADLEFHEAVAAASANPILIKLLNTINPLFTMRWLAWKSEIDDELPEIAMQVLNEHTMIMNAVIARDSDMARVAMQFHFKHAQQRNARHEAKAAARGAQ